MYIYIYVCSMCTCKYLQYVCLRIPVDMVVGKGGDGDGCKHTYRVYIYINAYIYTDISTYVPHMYRNICMCVYIYIHVFLHVVRERERPEKSISGDGKQRVLRIVIGVPQ